MKALRFVIVPKVHHPWFDEVRIGAVAQAELLRRQLGLDVAVEYVAPSSADVVEQSAVFERAAATNPDGVAIDPVDTVDRMASIRRAMDRGLSIILFDSPSPERGIPSVGNDFARQGIIAAERLVGLIGQSGKVAVMQGVPTAPNHKERYDAQIEVLKKHPGIEIVDGGVDDDDIARGAREAAAVLAKHPDLRGYLCCDASGPIGIAAAIRQAGRIGEVRVVGMDGIRPILEAIQEGIIDSSSSTIPRLQGAMSILMLWQVSLGGRIPQRIDTGIDVITRENVDRFLAVS